MPRWYQRTAGRMPEGKGNARLARLLLVGLILLLLIAGRRWWLASLARLLVVDQAPRAAGAILVLGGGDGSRAAHALALYEAGWAPLIITSGERPFLPDFERTRAELSADYVIHRGLPRESVLLLNETTSTRDEAVAGLAVAKERGFSTLLVVTDNYHSRRACWTFRHAFRGSGVQPIILSANPDWFQMDAWWAEERSFLAVTEEYEKLFFYLLKGFLF